jgi:dTDP-4-amino-4,6-dideoxygalactose transaminase
MAERVYLSPPHMGGREIAFVEEAFRANWVSPAGPNIDAFENELCKYNNISFCAGLSSGTAAIHLALILLGVEQGDEVICSTFTFAGTCNPVAYQKAIPVFVDSESQTWNMDPELLDETIKDRMKKGKKPKAIIPVHLYGMPAKISAIMKVARQYEIPVIEDAAEGLGASFDGKKLGTFGDIGVYSFNGNKIITTSGGGALVSNNDAWIKKAKFLATQARDPAPHYQHSEIGYNYRLSNISAGIGRGQLQVLDQRVNQRREIFDFYKESFNSSGIFFQPEMNGSRSNRWLTCILLPEESKVRPHDVMIALENENIESRPLWKPMHMQPVFSKAPVYGGSVSEKLFDTGICLPSGSNLSNDTLKRITSIVKSRLNYPIIRHN